MTHRMSMNTKKRGSSIAEETTDNEKKSLQVPEVNKLIKTKLIQPGCLLASFDMVSLFTNVSVGETLENIKKK